MYAYSNTGVYTCTVCTFRGKKHIHTQNTQTCKYMQKKTGYTTNTFSVIVRAKLILVVRSHCSWIAWEKKHKVAQHTVPVLRGKLQQHRDHDDGKEVGQFLLRVKNDKTFF